MADDLVIPPLSDDAMMKCEYLSSPYGTLHKIGKQWFDRHGTAFDVEIDDNEVIIRGPKING